jgi:hypothetical protein
LRQPPLDPPLQLGWLLLPLLDLLLRRLRGWLLLLGLLLLQLLGLLLPLPLGSPPLLLLGLLLLPLLALLLLPPQG